MQENKMIDQPNTGYIEYYNKKIAIKSIIFYILSMYIFNLIIQVFLIGIAPKITGFELYYTNEAGDKIIHKANEEFINAWTQILVYVVMAIGLIYINFQTFKNNIIYFKNNLKQQLFEIPIGIGLFYAATGLSAILMTLLKISDSSANQTALETIVEGKYGFIVLFTIIFLGPICEELVFRQSAFKIFRPDTKPWIKVAATGAIFGAIHITSAILVYFLEGNFKAIPTELLLGIPYIIQGITLSYVYYRSKENILPVTIIHIINNLIAGILMFI